MCHHRVRSLKAKMHGVMGIMLCLLVFISAVPVFAQYPVIDDPRFTHPILDPGSIPKYVTELPNPLTPGFIFVPDTETYPGTDFYEISHRQITWQVLPAGYPLTTVWAYGDPNDPGTFSYPGHTIVARSTYDPVNGSQLGKPVKVQYLNELPLTHILPVDHHIHGTMMGEPDVRTVDHLHGGKNVGPESDGYPDAWVTPDGKTIEDYLDPEDLPAIYTPYNPNPFDYPNGQEATMLWFHDHALGVTRLNVYAGLAALYMLRDDNEQWLVDHGNLPVYPYEVPIVIQDRMFYPDGSLAYPDAPAPSLPGYEPWPGGPSTLPEFFADVIVVNGVTWPFLRVEPRKYRIRFLNGSTSRFYKVFLSTGQPFYVLGMEGGFLPSPVMQQNLTIGPAERFDCIIDFAPYAGQTVTLKNNGKEPFPSGETVNPMTAGLIMQFRVDLPLSEVPDVTLANDLRPIAGPIEPLTPVNTRSVLLYETVDEFGRIKPMLGTPRDGKLEWDQPITENPMVGDVEVWEIYNTTEDAHPIHIHEIQFEVVSRQPFTATQDPETGALTNIKLKGQPKPPGPTESGYKETVIAPPGQVTRVVTRFETEGLFVWHCHILEHEEHEMMRPYYIGPIPPLLGKNLARLAGGTAQKVGASAFTLWQNDPNPFSPETRIRFQLPRAEHVVLRIYDAAGKEVRTLADRPFQAGVYSLPWGGSDDNGSPVASGVYFYKLQAGALTKMGRMSLVR